MKMNELIKLDEPLLLFGHNQALEDPRDGLTIFGPLKHKPPYGIRYGLVGTKEGIKRFYEWIKCIQHFLCHPDPSKRILWIPFPGFETTFGIPLPLRAAREDVIDLQQLTKILKENDPYKRVYNTVNLYENPISDFYRKSDENLDIWFVISPEEIFKNCRPQSKVFNPATFITGGEIKKRKKWAKLIKLGQKLLFKGLEKDYEVYEFQNDFRKQLKARLIISKMQTPIQIVRETTVAPDDFLDRRGERIRDLQPESQIAWNLLSTTFYKSGGKSWKLHGIRKGVCYLGLVYKRLEKYDDPKSACCAAQMFLDSGDGVVFKGAVGPWKSPKSEQYHLSKDAAKEIIEMALRAYTEFFGFRGTPKEIFIHGRTYYDKEEWKGFASVQSNKMNVVGVRIRPAPLRLFRSGDYPLLRGLAYLETDKKGYLWPSGYVPRLGTYPYQGLPSPLSIQICRGIADIKTVIKDIFALTKLNYNACHYGDGWPITLSFADMIGEILTAAPIQKDEAPLPFKFYI